MKINLYRLTRACLNIFGIRKNKNDEGVKGQFKAAAEKRAEYAQNSDTYDVDFLKFFENKEMNDILLQHNQIGPLNLPTGRIIACDPFYVGEEFTAPFERQVEPGKYPVIVVTGDFGWWGNRVAFAGVKLSDSKPARWELAKNILDQEAFNSLYGVDGGIGSFSDSEAAELLHQTLTAFYQQNPTGNYYEDILADEFALHVNWNDHRPDPQEKLNVIMFSSGFGDGVYSSYWGLDIDGDVAWLVTDFQLFTPEGTILSDVID
ncbi:MAG: DUF4241 domain-containing protein [Chloroflexota bacterium]